MYISGLSQTFENRLHQLPTSTGDLFYFRTEDNSYFFNTGQKQHINKEYQRKYFSITRDASYLTGWYLSADIIANTEYPLDYIYRTYGSGAVNFAYSFRKLSTGYDGPILDASNGSVIVPMFAGSDGELLITGMNVFGNSYVGVRRFYDQSNRNRHISTSSATLIAAIFYTGAPIVYDGKQCGYHFLNTSGTTMTFSYTGHYAMSGDNYTGILFRDGKNSVYTSFGMAGNGLNFQSVISEHARISSINWAAVAIGTMPGITGAGLYYTYRNNGGSQSSATQLGVGNKTTWNNFINYNDSAYVDLRRINSFTTGLARFATGAASNVSDVYLFSLRAATVNNNIFSGYFRETIAFSLPINPTGFL